MTKAQEDALRAYLTALKNPSELRDEDRLAELDKAIKEATDPLEELTLRGEFNRLSSVDPSDYEKGFVEHAKAYADDKGINAEAYRSMGVPNEVLKQAGFDVSVSPGRKRATSTGKRVSQDDVREFIGSLSDNFTINFVSEATGASLATTRAVIKDMLEAGSIKNLGDDPDHTGRGRPATLYKAS